MNNVDYEAKYKYCPRLGRFTGRTDTTLFKYKYRYKYNTYVIYYS